MKIEYLRNLGNISSMEETHRVIEMLSYWDRLLDVAEVADGLRRKYYSQELEQALDALEAGE